MKLSPRIMGEKTELGMVVGLLGSFEDPLERS